MMLHEKEESKLSNQKRWACAQFIELYVSQNFDNFENNVNHMANNPQYIW